MLPTLKMPGVAVVLAALLGFLPLDAQGPAPTSSPLVVVGDSLTAGFQNFSLFDSNSVAGAPPGGQRDGYAALVARQAGLPLTLPLISLPGIPPVLTLTPTGQIVRGTVPGYRLNPTAQATNLSVPGFRVVDALARAFPGDPLNDPVDAMSALILALPGTVPGCGPFPASSLPEAIRPASALAVSSIVCAATLQPNLVLVSLGGNDALQAVTFGLPPTDPGVFAAQYALVLQMLTQGRRPTVIVSNIPDVTVLPFLMPVPVFTASCPAAVLPPTVTAADFIVPNIVDPTVSTFDICENYAVRTAALIAQTRAAIASYNSIIDGLASQTGAVVIDLHGLFERLRGGYVVGGRLLTADFLGGLLSLDGIHPTNTGYAIIANETIKTMNRKLDLRIPPIALTRVAERDPLVFSTKPR